MKAMANAVAEELKNKSVDGPAKVQMTIRELDQAR